MQEISLAEIAMLLAAAAIAAPLGRWLRIGTVLGYLLAGVLLGPYGVGQVFSLYQAKEFLHFAEFGVVLLLFLIGLELRPKRLWSMRKTIFGVGGSQVGLTTLALTLIGYLLGLEPLTAFFLGLVLSLSSTAFALQVLEENDELTTRHGRTAFSVLLFQDIAAIPLIALVPLFAVGATDKAAPMSAGAALQALAMIALVVMAGRLLVDPFLQLVARAKVKEAMTAAALLTVIAAAWVMQSAGISAALGAFLAGAMLAESSYRHQLEADIKPFEGLLLGLFFTAVGMSLNLDLIVEQPFTILAVVAGLVAVKAGVLYGLGRWLDLEPAPSRRFALSLSQGGEFAFVLLAAGAAAGALERPLADIFAVIVTLSMAATPLLLTLDSALSGEIAPDLPEQDIPDNEGHVIIAGFGRVGQIVARILRAKRIPFTALDLDPGQISLVTQFGNEAYYGDASRLDILTVAEAEKARALVLAIDDVEASVRTAEIVRQHYPDLPVIARARNRNHVHRLMDLGIDQVHRETFIASLDMTRDLLRGLGDTTRDIDYAIETFAEHDKRRLVDDYAHFTDLEKMRNQALSDAENLAKLFDEDAMEQAKLAVAELDAEVKG